MPTYLLTPFHPIEVKAENETEAIQLAEKKLNNHINAIKTNYDWDIEEIQKHTTITIDKDEILDTLCKMIKNHEISSHTCNDNQIQEILSFIENDEKLWHDIEESKKSAILFILQNSDL